MQTRRITALLLTAFLVAELLWRWQGGIVQPAATSGAWAEVTQGAYLVQGGYLVPYGTGRLLRRTALGVVTVRPAWTERLRDLRVAVFGSGQDSIAVGETNGRSTLLPRYGDGFLLLDAQQNLWQIQTGRMTLLMGGGSGPQSRTMLEARTAALQRQGIVPKAWQLVWAADPLVVGSAVWYLSNRDGALGVAMPHVWRLEGAANAALGPLAQFGRLDLVTAGPGGVVAMDAQGDLLRFDSATLALQARLTGYQPLAAAQGELLLLRGIPGKAPRLYVAGSDWARLEPLSLPVGTAVLGPARFSSDGQSVALLVRREGRTLVYVAQAWGQDTGALGQLLAPPGGAQVQGFDQPSLSAGKVYLVVRNEGKEETWARSVGEGQTAFRLDGAGEFAFAGERLALR